MEPFRARQLSRARRDIRPRSDPKSRQNALPLGKSWLVEAMVCEFMRSATRS
jgi:hypothetical protein